MGKEWDEYTWPEKLNSLADGLASSARDLPGIAEKFILARASAHRRESM